MPADKPAESRPYRQTRRAAITAQTRARVVDSARTLLLEHGYAGTSMRAVAEHAEVGVRTVFDYFPTKTDLLKTVVETAIVGDLVPIRASGRSWFQEIIEEPDENRRAALLARASTRLHQRTAALFAVARGAAADDAEAARLWRAGKAGHRSDCERFARAVLGDTDKAAIRSLTTSLYVLIGPETYTLLTDELGSTPRAYEKWLRDRLTSLFQEAAAWVR